MSRTFKMMVGGLVALFVLTLALSAKACGGGGGYRMFRPSYVCNYEPAQPQVIIQQVPVQQPIVQQPAPQQFAQPQFNGQQFAPQGPQNGAPNNGSMQPVSPNSGNQFPGSSQVSAQQSALDALSGWDGSEVATPASHTASPAGNYAATLNGGATIRLTLNTDGSFRWTATRDGKTTVGQGNYTLANGAMKLVRTGDQQKLEGGFVATQQGFMLKIAGQKEQTLNFVRV